MKILGIILIIAAVLNIIACIFAAADKIKPKKSTQIIYYIIVSMLLFGSALRMFSR